MTSLNLGTLKKEATDLLEYLCLTTLRTVGTAGLGRKQIILSFGGDGHRIIKLQKSLLTIPDIIP